MWRHPDFCDFVLSFYVLTSLESCYPVEWWNSHGSKWIEALRIHCGTQTALLLVEGIRQHFWGFSMFQSPKSFFCAARGKIGPQSSHVVQQSHANYDHEIIRDITSLTVTSLKLWLVRGIIPTWPYFSYFQGSEVWQLSHIYYILYIMCVCDYMYVLQINKSPSKIVFGFTYNVD